MCPVTRKNSGVIFFQTSPTPQLEIPTKETQ